MDYLDISDYGLIGNMHTVALVGMNGSIDWFCPRKFDDPSVFAKILDADIGGFFQICTATDDPKLKQFYWHETNVLVTRFICANAIVELIDYMPVHETYEKMTQHWIIRRVKVIRGEIDVQVTCQPAFDYARADHDIRETDNGIIFHTDETAFALSSPIPLDIDGDGISTTVHMEEGETHAFSLQLLDPDATECEPPLTPEEEEGYFTATVDYWHDWLTQCTYRGRWREIIYRSALVMKLLTYQPTGAIVAAPTTSLPEDLGGERNWDYRYTWLRDAAFTVYGFIRIGFTEEARDFTRWIQDRMREIEPDGSLQVMYTIDGDHDLEEFELDHLSGYKNSTPVRVGNAAHKQLQLDIYGELMDSIYLYNKYAEPVSYELWGYVRQILAWVCDNWQRHDKGIWEVRGVDKPFVYSKVMLWVALDRGIRLAEKRSLPAPMDEWRTVRDTIYEEIMERGWNEELKTFTQYYDGETLDASNLIMPLVFFMSPSDPRMLQTIDSINRPPDEGGLTTDGFVLRYDTKTGVDGLDGDEGAFNMCTFWLVEALTRAGRIDEARQMFEQMLSYANHVGLYAEQTGFRGEALGNYPQAFTHLALISAAYNLDRALGE